MDRDELAAFLRAHRATVSPREAGLPETGLSRSAQRRTPGLRRQEVAQLAGISVDYYIRLEQGRGPNPSAQVVSALARALMLNADERDYLLRVAGHPVQERIRPSREITPGIRTLLDGMPSTPAYVVDAAYNILAWNKLATRFIGDLSGEQDRNMIRWTFTTSSDDVHWSDEDAVRFARSTVADLRASYARYPGEKEIESLVNELLALSPRFAEMWESREVEVRGPMMKRFTHPEFGPLEFECQVLHIATASSSTGGQRIIAYCAAPGSPTAAAFQAMAAELEHVRFVQSSGQGHPA